MEKEQIIKVLSLKEFEIIRIYKKYFVWMIVIDNKQSEIFENHLRNSSIGEV